jgi:hypothetical protein
MKDCRFCGAMIPFYGGDTCRACLERGDAEYRRKREECARECGKTGAASLDCPIHGEGLGRGSDRLHRIGTRVRMANLPEWEGPCPF